MKPTLTWATALLLVTSGCAANRAEDAATTPAAPELGRPATAGVQAAPPATQPGRPPLPEKDPAQVGQANRPTLPAAPVHPAPVGNGIALPKPTAGQTVTASLVLPPAPPARPGDSRHAFEGCLAEPERMPSSGGPPSQSNPSDEPELTAVDGGVVLTHPLRHACCLKGAVESVLKGRTLEVEETLSGKPCRCMCQSTIRTAVALPPGDYQVKLRLKEAGGTKVALDRPLSIAKP